jgi:hypothetical protein
MSPLSFRVNRWAAWAPGLADPSAWAGWLAAPDLAALAGEATPLLAELPAMTRRRIDPLGRAALQAAFWAQGDAETGPVVFSSRWGEIARSVGLLQQLAQGEPLSPTAFSLSVHNASSAVYSIARGDTANYSALSAGPHSAAAAVSEALGLLADSASSVLVVSVEAALPAPYERFEARCLPMRAWAALLEAGGDVSLTTQAVDDTPTALPADLAVLQLLTGHAAELQQGRWRWSRHG